MSPLVAFILGLLVGWLVEWVIDWLYWRKKINAAPAARSGDLEVIARLESELNSLRADKRRLENLVSVRDDEIKDLGSRPVGSVQAQPDDFTLIEPVDRQMSERMHRSGIRSFTDLAAVRPNQLRELLGGVPLPPGEAVEIIKQARVHAGMFAVADDLIAVNGIGPVIARLLNEAGIFTFAELAALNPEQLRELVGDRIERLANEEKILGHARQLAEEKQHTG